MRSASLLSGWIDADPTLVGIVIVAIALSALTYVWKRLRARGMGA